MSSAARDLAGYLATAGAGALGGTADWAIRVGREDPAPDKSVTLYDVGGDEPDTDELDLRPEFQVRVRSDDYLAGHAKAEEIRDLLMVPATIVAGAATYLGVEATSDVAHIGRDDGDRDLFTANYRTRKERS